MPSNNNWAEETGESLSGSSSSSRCSRAECTTNWRLRAGDPIEDAMLKREKQTSHSLFRRMAKAKVRSLRARTERQAEIGAELKANSEKTEAGSSDSTQNEEERSAASGSNDSDSAGRVGCLATAPAAVVGTHEKEVLARRGRKMLAAARNSLNKKKKMRCQRWGGLLIQEVDFDRVAWRHHQKSIKRASALVADAWKQANKRERRERRANRRWELNRVAWPSPLRESQTDGP